ncbi:MAG: hypothetical protein SGJ18_13800 [Pseudomonadota bacterium]|nr:hypothetical protein [Pseudomonadota bacterium]
MQIKREIKCKLQRVVVLILCTFQFIGCISYNGTDTGNANERLYASQDLTLALCYRLIECGAAMTDSSCRSFSFGVQNAPAKYGLGATYNNLTLTEVYNDEVANQLTFDIGKMLSCTSELAAISCSAPQMTTFIADAPNFLSAKYLSILDLPTTCIDVFE